MYSIYYLYIKPPYRCIYVWWFPTYLHTHAYINPYKHTHPTNSHPTQAYVCSTMHALRSLGQFHINSAH